MRKSRCGNRLRIKRNTVVRFSGMVEIQVRKFIDSAFFLFPGDESVDIHKQIHVFFRHQHAELTMRERLIDQRRRKPGILTGIVAPNAVALIGFLMFGNLIRECGVLNSLSDTAQTALPNLVTLFLGITIAEKMQADAFLNPQTILILCLGLVAFIFDTAGGVIFAKIINIFAKKKINPMIGAAGISAFPMSSRVVHKLGLEEDPTNFLLTHTIGINVSGQIASVIAGGLILNLIPR